MSWKIKDKLQDQCKRGDRRFFCSHGQDHGSGGAQGNGFVELVHRTLRDEHFRIKGRTMHGRNPFKALMDGLKDLKINSVKAAE
jgi:hypothetical protein